MKEDDCIIIKNPKLDIERYVKRFKSLKGNKENYIQITSKNEEATKMFDSLNKTLLHYGNVAMSVYRYIVFRKSFASHEIVEIIEHSTTPDMIIIERK